MQITMWWRVRVANVPIDEARAIGRTDIIDDAARRMYAIIRMLVKGV